MSHEEQMKKHCPECVGLTGKAHEDCMKKNCPQLLDVELAKRKKKQKEESSKRAYSSPIIISEVTETHAIQNHR